MTRSSRPGMSEIERLIGDRVAAAATAREAIAGFVTVRTEYFQQHPDFFRVYVAEFARQVAAGADERSGCQLALERQTRALQRVMEKAVANGEVRSVDPEAAALAVFDMSKGLVGRRLLIGSRSSVQRDIAFLTDLIWSVCSPREERRNDGSTFDVVLLLTLLAVPAAAQSGSPNERPLRRQRAPGHGDRGTAPLVAAGRAHARPAVQSRPAAAGRIPARLVGRPQARPRRAAAERAGLGPRKPAGDQPRSLRLSPRPIPSSAPSTCSTRGWACRSACSISPP